MTRPFFINLLASLIQNADFPIVMWTSTQLFHTKHKINIPDKLFLIIIMTEQQTKVLYEQIMSEVALMVKKRLNEAYDSGALKKFIAFAQSLAKKNNKYYEIHFIKNGKNYDVINVRYDGTLYNGTYKNCLSDLTDDNIYGKKFYEHDDLTKVLKGKSPSWKNLKQSTTG